MEWEPVGKADFRLWRHVWKGDQGKGLQACRSLGSPRGQTRQMGIGGQGQRCLSTSRGKEKTRVLPLLPLAAPGKAGPFCEKSMQHHEQSVIAEYLKNSFAVTGILPPSEG